MKEPITASDYSEFMDHIHDMSRDQLELIAKVIPYLLERKATAQDWAQRYRPSNTPHLARIKMINADIIKIISLDF